MPTPSGQVGHFNWTQPMLQVVIVNGNQLAGYASLDWTKPELNPASMRNLAGGHVTQRILRGVSAPASLRTRTLALKILSGSETDYFALETAEERGQAVAAYPDKVIVDTWDAIGGQQTFSTSREIAYGSGLPGLTPSVRPARAFLNGAEQAVVYTGSPSAGQVLVPTTAGAQRRAIVAGAPLNAADILELRYYPMLYVVFSQVQRGTPQANQLDYSAQLIDQLIGAWD